jgi:tetratricopeptide (TPR) repeat protein
LAVIRKLKPSSKRPSSSISTYADAFHNLGSAYAEQAKWEDAIVAYRKALAQTLYASPENTYNNLGYAYWALDRRKEAEEAFRSALQLEPKLVPSHFWLGVLLEKEGRKDEARVHFQAARDLEPGSVLGKRAAEVLKVMGERK